jgi:hypothetical protein
MLNLETLDPNHDIPLEEISSLSGKACSLFLRTFLEVPTPEAWKSLSAIWWILAGLEYHYNNYINLYQSLTEGESTVKPYLQHEIVAYLNRMGQFYFFAKSPYVKTTGIDSEAIIPTIRKLIIFRNKQASHRSIDDPRKESEEEHWAHMHSLMSTIMIPKAGSSGSISKENMYQNCYFQYQTYDAVTQSTVFFVLEQDHKDVIQEAYNLFEQVVNHYAEQTTPA